MKKQIPLAKKYKSPHLYREDLEEIESIIKQELQPRKIQIEFDEHEFASVSEIPKDFLTSSNFELNTSSPNLYITLQKYSRSLRIYDEDLKVAGVFAKIDQIIDSRDRKTLSNILILLKWCTLPIYILFLFTPYLKYSSHELKIATILVSALVLFLLYFFSFFYSFKPKVDFIYRRENKGFFRRKKDDIILVIFSAFLGCIFTIIVTLLLKK